MLKLLRGERKWANRFGYILLCVGVAGALTMTKFNIDKVCDAQRNDWDTWQRVISNVRHPALAEGVKLSQRQMDGLERYADSLAVSVGDEPDC